MDACDDEVRAKVRELKAVPAEKRGFALPASRLREGGLDGDMRAVCGSENAGFLADGSLMRIAHGGKQVDLVRVDELLVKGEHNAANALAASAAALALGADASAVRDGLRSFSALEHRIEPAGEIGGVSCYNDSKATNVDAVLKALVAFSPVKPYILLGGRDKGTDLSPLVRACAESARGVVCFGEARLASSRLSPPCRARSCGRRGGDARAGPRRRARARIAGRRRPALARVRVVRRVLLLRGAWRRVQALCPRARCRDCGR